MFQDYVWLHSRLIRLSLGGKFYLWNSVGSWRRSPILCPSVCPGTLRAASVWWLSSPQLLWMLPSCERGREERAQSEAGTKQWLVKSLVSSCNQIQYLPKYEDFADTCSLRELPDWGRNLFLIFLFFLQVHNIFKSFQKPFKQLEIKNYYSLVVS